MRAPVTIDFHNVATSEFVVRRIRGRAERLSRLCDRVTGCRVVVEAPKSRHRQGSLYQVHITIDVPGDRVRVGHEAGGGRVSQDIYVAVRNAFDAAERRLLDKVHRIPRHPEARPASMAG